MAQPLTSAACRAVVIALALSSGFVVGAAGRAAALETDEDIVGGDIFLRARQATDGLNHYEDDPGRGAYEWKRDLPCWSRAPEIDDVSHDLCWGGSAVQHDPPECEDGDALQPIWRRIRDVNPWEQQVGWHCPEDLLPAVAEDDFRQLTITPLRAHMQPDRGEVLVNKPTIVYTEAEPATFRTELLGFGLDIEATPIAFVWDFGDGERPLETTSPGHPYPDHDLARSYREPGSARITLYTTWTGRYRVDIDPLHKWRDIDGTAFTTSSTPQFEIVELRSHLDG
ncbi:hypothetical protein F1D97_13930 [Cellulomonas palmilytica]|uniref:hypothetical protein n=1 Tax=Cellulomonas sp. PSBB021 TaxID=2003551 RepID=UPI000B8DADA8|nr:hypothetical protein [Cellulomonas sp. PSBB021]ASR54887.1 hypothetical protein CBP52_06965 [Cellulomonas sp. PSBB021]UJP39418.1 hypothetical protein F1D97_13930 [Cellulomonas palmilytica]